MRAGVASKLAPSMKSRQLKRMNEPLTDATTTIQELKGRVLEFARERDWEQFHAPKNLSMALAAEAGSVALPDHSATLLCDGRRRLVMANV